VSSTDGKGYLLIAKDGGGFAFGDYVFNGSMGGKAALTLRWWAVGLSNHVWGY